MNASPAFAFVQFELPYPPGPAAGRHVVRERLSEFASHVIVVNEITTKARPRRWPRPQREPPNPAPARLSLWRLTVVEATPLAVEATTSAALRSRDHRSDLREAAGRADRFLYFHALATEQPPRGTSLITDSLGLRVGIGRGDQVADGKWDAALNVPRNLWDDTEPHLAEQERLAALLTGLDAALACERFTRLARAELEADRTREAALATDAAIRAAIAELPAWDPGGSAAPSVQRLRTAQRAVAEAAEAACHGGLPADAIETIVDAISALELALRKRERQRPRNHSPQ